MLEKLQRLAIESENELIEMGFGEQIKSKTRFYTISRAKRRLGQCVGKKDINISSWLLEIGTDKDIKNTIIHEILHTFDDTIGHKEKWKYYANKVNSYGVYNITRTTNIANIYAKANKQRPINNDYKWEITCTKCGKVWYWQRLTKKGLNAFTENKRTHKSCGGKDFKIVDLHKGELIW